MRAFVDECHRQGIAVIIDLVLNHSFGQSPFYLLYREAEGLRRQIIPGIIKSLIFLMLLCSGDMILIIKVRIPVRWWTVWPVSGWKSIKWMVFDTILLKDFPILRRIHGPINMMRNVSQTWSGCLRKSGKGIGCLCYYRTSDGGYYGREGIGRGRHHALEKHESCVLWIGYGMAG